MATAAIAAAQDNKAPSLSASGIGQDAVTDVASFGGQARKERVSHTFLTSEFTAGPSDRVLGVSRVMAAGARGTDAPAGPPGGAPAWPI